jgi:hypothetical protein
VFVVLAYSVLAIPLIVWALNPQLGAAMIRGMMSALRRVPLRVHSFLSCVRDATALKIPLTLSPLPLFPFPWGEGRGGEELGRGVTSGIFMVSACPPADGHERLPWQTQP